MKIKGEWVHYLTRPFTLFAASLWQEWYDSPYAEKILGSFMKDFIALEEHPHVVRKYVVKEQLNNLKYRMDEIVIKDPELCKKLLEEGLDLNIEAEEIISNKGGIKLGEAVNFMIRLVNHSTIIPYFVFEILSKNIEKDTGSLKLAKKLRSISYYPLFIQKVIVPLAEEFVGEKVELLTISEVLAKDTTKLKERYEQKEKNKRFLYSKVGGVETIKWVENPLSIMEEIEEIKIENFVQGSVACPGPVRGKVRLVLSDIPNEDFEEGEVLVAPSTNPQLFPIMKRCKGIVTDEGGVTSHAAIISRELNKPCIIGTKYATHTFKTGDIIEFGFRDGIVRKIE